MNAEKSRLIVVDALHVANVPGLKNHSGLDSFIAGVGDVELSTMDLDSLGKMEFCIYLEIHHGISIVPDKLNEFKTLAILAKYIEAWKS
jgi:hypothetical protein